MVEISVMSLLAGGMLGMTIALAREAGQDDTKDSGPITPKIVAAWGCGLLTILAAMFIL